MKCVPISKKLTALSKEMLLFLAGETKDLQRHSRHSLSLCMCVCVVVLVKEIKEAVIIDGAGSKKIKQLWRCSPKKSQLTRKDWRDERWLQQNKKKPGALPFNRHGLG